MKWIYVYLLIYFVFIVFVLLNPITVVIPCSTITLQQFYVWGPMWIYSNLTRLYLEDCDKLQVPRTGFIFPVGIDQHDSSFSFTVTVAFSPVCLPSPSAIGLTNPVCFDLQSLSNFLLSLHSGEDVTLLYPPIRSEASGEWHTPEEKCRSQENIDF